MWASASRLLKREMLIYYRRGNDALRPVLFFVMVALLFPLATTTNPVLLTTIGPGVIWIAALLAILLSLPELFRDDYQDGSLAQLLLNPQPLAFLIFLKIIANWLMIILPLIILAPVMALLFHLSGFSVLILIISLLMGSLILELLGAIVAGLTVGLRNSGLLMAVLLLPLFIPTLIFSTMAVASANQHLPITAPLAILAAILMLALVLAPWVTSFALRISVNF